MLNRKLLQEFEKTRGRELGSRQVDFLNAFSNSLSIEKAAEDCNIDIKDRAAVVRSIRKEIMEVIEYKLLDKAGTAASTLGNILDATDPIVQGSLKLEAAKTILDRIGLGKKEEVAVTHQGSLGLFVLPGKAEKVIN